MHPLFICLTLACLSLNAEIFSKQTEQTKPTKHVEEISIQQLNDWDKTTSSLLKENPLGVGGSNRLYAYLYNGQKMFADASLKETRGYNGNIGTISGKILQLFFPSFQDKNNITDSFSDNLSDKVMATLRKRFEEEKKQMHPLQIQITSMDWKGKEPYYGLENATMKPWVLKSANEFRLPVPPSLKDQQFWKGQLDMVKMKLENVTEEQRKLTYFWAGMSGPGSGDWFAIANDYMNKNNVPLKKRLEVRATLATALFDTMVAVYDSKYKYLVKRPFMHDASIETLITTPNHPSYPAGHSADSAAAETVMSYFFPENAKNWKQRSEDGGNSRIWSGLHFPIDHEAGITLGRNVANAVLQRSGTN